MRIHCVMHAPFEGLGIIESWAQEKNHELSRTNIYRGETLPLPDAFDFLILMGGPQSVCELEAYPYLKKEIQLIQAAHQKDKHILGICLGGQLISVAFGGIAEKSPEKEVGYFPVTLTSHGKKDPVFRYLPEAFQTLHWHHDMMGLPKQAELLATSDGCPRQAIRFDARVYGLQFHLEFSPRQLQTLIQKCAGDLTESRYTHTPAEMGKADFQASHALMKSLLDKLVEN